MLFDALLWLLWTPALIQHPKTYSSNHIYLHIKIKYKLIFLKPEINKQILILSLMVSNYCYYIPIEITRKRWTYYR